MPKKKAKTPPNRDPQHMATIGRSGGEKTRRRHGKAHFKKIAALSHPRDKYYGGRKPKKRDV